MLFAVGKSLIGIYLRRAAPSSPYGAAGALIALMFWTYYSAQIFLFGAELTKAIARPPIAGLEMKNPTASGPEDLTYWRPSISASVTDSRVAHWSVGQGIEPR
ncbi:YhjD/YihY/BrkB family envelope integrity protein [Bradyrhizobium sp. CCBAU 11361]|uniref:YhjD/YihY/BrkB family envelope integrity protein n=1 Tax=Bradyrhizobium sp. CCBAU 11361 TaxID=1630812 RepID=UPI002302A9FD|nr:YhjD/YihY/BrkB family envelope integrity protein [Bradyrhizobium sp. CCBAU 11361]